jgi:hypothetical protein
MTAQAETDIAALTDSDYNSLRASIYSPNIQPAIEVKHFNIFL